MTMQNLGGIEHGLYNVAEAINNLAKATDNASIRDFALRFEDSAVSSDQEERVSRIINEHIHVLK